MQSQVRIVGFSNWSSGLCANSFTSMGCSRSYPCLLYKRLISPTYPQVRSENFAAVGIYLRLYNLSKNHHLTQYPSWTDLACCPMIGTYRYVSCSSLPYFYPTVCVWKAVAREERDWSWVRLREASVSNGIPHLELQWKRVECTAAAQCKSEWI